MTDVETTEELPPVAGATIVYLGPVAPHWEIRGHFGEEKIIDDFRTRVNARLLLLPRHDPQFRRNRERVNRDAERELIRLDWDLGDEPSPATPAADPPTADVAPAVEEIPAEGETPAADVNPGEQVPVEGSVESAPVESAPEATPADDPPEE